MHIYSKNDPYTVSSWNSLLNEFVGLVIQAGRDAWNPGGFYRMAATRGRLTQPPKMESI